MADSDYNRNAMKTIVFNFKCFARISLCMLIVFFFEQIQTF